MNDLICMRHITKRFPGVLALNDVSFSLQAGEVHALLGENGAGKSTLMKILAGMYQPNSGSIMVDGHEVQIKYPQDALKAGIGMVYQHFTLSPELTVLENILLGSKLPFFLNTKALEAELLPLIESYGLKVDLKAKVWQLSVGEQQRVEIIKCFYSGARILILDEPTAVLTPPETAELFEMVRCVVGNGCSVIFISHKLNEVMEIADRITVFRKGTVVGSIPKSEADIRRLSCMMVGRDVDLGEQPNSCQAGKPVLYIEDVSAKNDKGLPALNSVSLTLHEQEIVGIAAVSGNGQAELAEVISGLRKASGGSITLNTGESLFDKTIREIIELGVGHISEKRLGRSLIPCMSIAQNLVVKDYKARRYCKHGLLNSAAIRENASKMIQAYEISAPGPETPVQVLSGGNVQKVVLARELERKPRVLLAVNPTYGLDVGAIEFVQKRLREERGRGATVLLISEELDEVIRLSDRIAVMSKGEIVAVLEKEQFSRENIGLLMTGGTLNVVHQN